MPLTRRLGALLVISSRLRLHSEVGPSFVFIYYDSKYECLGVAVYVICITVQTNSTDDGTNDLSFAVDGLTNNKFEKVPVSSSATAFDFNQTVFSLMGLSNSTHTLLIQTGLIDQKAVILLDAIIYTKDDGRENSQGSEASASSGLPPSSTPPSTVDQPGITNQATGHQDSFHSTPKPVIFAVVGAVLTLCCIGAILFYLHRRRRLSWRKGISPLIIVGPQSSQSGTSTTNQAGPSNDSYFTSTSYFTGNDSETSPEEPNGDGNLNVPNMGAATRASPVIGNPHSSVKAQVRRSSFARRPGQARLSPIGEAASLRTVDFSSQADGTTLPAYESLI